MIQPGSPSATEQFYFGSPKNPGFYVVKTIGGNQDHVKVVDLHRSLGGSIPTDFVDYPVALKAVEAMGLRGSIKGAVLGVIDDALPVWALYPMESGAQPDHDSGDGNVSGVYIVDALDGTVLTSWFPWKGCIGNVASPRIALLGQAAAPVPGVKLDFSCLANAGHAACPSKAPLGAVWIPLRRLSPNEFDEVDIAWQPFQIHVTPGLAFVDASKPHSDYGILRARLDQISASLCGANTQHGPFEPGLANVVTPARPIQ